MRALLLCLFLAACAAPERHDLRDGAPVAPVFVTPGYTPAGAGLPEYMPGHPEPVRIEPNPRPNRLLPQTPKTRQGPGIWASDAPDATDPRDDGQPAPLVLGVRLPYWTTQDEPADREHTRQCAARGDRLLRRMMTPSEVTALSDAERACLAMQMYDLCSLRIWEGMVRGDETLSASERSMLRTLIKWTASRVTAACTSEAWTQRIRDLHDKARDAWWGRE